MRGDRVFSLGGLMSVALMPGVGAADSSACDALKDAYANNTLLPSESGYDEATQDSWSTTSWLSPACVFQPSDADQLSAAVQIFNLTQTQFAIRGGGHMPIKDAANIAAPGVLVSCAKLNGIEFSDDKSVLKVGSGPRWTEVFQFLNGTGLAVVGARLGAVGVPGFLLGGGLSYYSYEKGLASTNGNIVGYECVLADGTVAYATGDNEYSDLYWALQGGGNNFCLVTRFDLKTFSSPVTMIADASYGSGNATKDAWMDSILDLAHNGDQDPRAATIPLAQYGVGYDAPVYHCSLFYNGDEASPDALKNFLGGKLTPVLDNPTPLTPSANGTALNNISLANYAAMMAPAFKSGGASHGLRQRFHLVPTLATAEALTIVHDAYFSAVRDQLIASNITSFITGLAVNPITTTLLKATNAAPGVLEGLDETPVLWIEESCSWSSEVDDETMEKFFKAVNEVIDAKLGTTLKAKYYYLNDADIDQPVFETYTNSSFKKMRDIREQYDPERVYTDLLPGGFKLDN